MSIKQESDSMNNPHSVILKLIDVLSVTLWGLHFLFVGGFNFLDIRVNLIHNKTGYKFGIEICGFLRHFFRI